MRSSSASVSTNASFARMACAARTPNVASGPATRSLGSGSSVEHELEDAERRLAEPDAGDRAFDRDRRPALEHGRHGLLELRDPRLVDRDLGCERERVPIGCAPQHRSRGPARLRRNLDELAGTSPRGKRERSPASASSRSRRASLSPTEPSSAARTSAACAAADSASETSFSANGSPDLSNSSSPTTSFPRLMGMVSAEPSCPAPLSGPRDPTSSAETTADVAQTARAARSPLASSRRRTTAASARSAFPMASVSPSSASGESRIARSWIPA